MEKVAVSIFDQDADKVTEQIKQKFFTSEPIKPHKKEIDWMQVALPIISDPKRMKKIVIIISAFFVIGLTVSVIFTVRIIYNTAMQYYNYNIPLWLGVLSGLLAFYKEFTGKVVKAVFYGFPIAVVKAGKIAWDNHKKKKMQEQIELVTRVMDKPTFMEKVKTEITNIKTNAMATKQANSMRTVKQVQVKYRMNDNGSYTQTPPVSEAGYDIYGFDKDGFNSKGYNANGAHRSVVNK